MLWLNMCDYIEANVMARDRGIGGFTLLELMIAIGVIAIIATFAYPSYQNSIYKARRSDGKAGLLGLQQAQELFRANCIEYADNIVAAGSGVCNIATAVFSVEYNSTSAGGYYNLSAEGSVTTYTLTATHTGNQTEDTDCKTLSIDQEGNKTATDGSDNPSFDCW